MLSPPESQTARMDRDTPFVMGIDLGTTRCCVAVIEHGNPRVIHTLDDSRVFHSTVSFKENTVIVGEDDMTTRADSQGFIFNAKFHLAKGENQHLRNESYPWKLKENGDWISYIGGEEVTPVDITAFFLAHAKIMAQEHHNTTKEVDVCVITVPAHFTFVHKEATLNAAKIAGLTEIRFLLEPTAAALAYFSRSRFVEGDFLIIDIGGGTTDCSLIHQETIDGTRSFDVKATSGNQALGGYQFLVVLFRLFKAKLKKLKAKSIPDHVLYRLSESAKVNASRRTSNGYQIFVDDMTIKVTNQEFSDELRPELEKLRKVIDKCLLPKVKISGALLTGGGSCLKPVASFIEILMKNKDIPLLSGRPPPEANAEGAAYYGLDDNIHVQEKLPRSLGVETQGRMGPRRWRPDLARIEYLLMKNESLPASAESDLFVTVVDKVSHVILYEGENTSLSENSKGSIKKGTQPSTKLGTFEIHVPKERQIMLSIEATIEKVTLTASEVVATDSAGQPVVVKKGNLGVKRGDFGMTPSMLEASRDKIRRINNSKPPAEIDQTTKEAAETPQPRRGSRKRKERSD